MRFGHFDLDHALGMCLAHTLKFEGHILRKGRVLSKEDLTIMGRAGVDTVVGAFLTDQEVDENIAAEMAGNLLAGPNLQHQPAAKGRCNLKATTAGVLMVDAAMVNQANGVDAALTLATLPAFSTVRSGQVVAMVKTIPFAVARKTLDEWQTVFSSNVPLRLAPFRHRSVGLLMTTSEATSDKLLASTAAVVRARLITLGSELTWEMSCPHDIDSVGLALRHLQANGAELILISGASVSKDLSDTVPAALVSVGGEVIHFGMPVYPGNMLLYGCLGAVPVIHLPGCARSRHLNGFDWILQRLLADLPLTAADIMGMGVGGILTSRTEGDVVDKAEDGERQDSLAGRPARIGALILAAGRSSRMGRNKLLCQIKGDAMVRRPVSAALASRCVLTMVVTGYQSDDIEQTLQDQPVSLVYNAKFGEGMATSLRCGLRALPQDLDGVVILLADMPHVSSEHIDRLIAAFDPTAPAIVAPMRNGRRGNPVLWPHCYFAEMLELQGDQGARGLIELHAADAVLIEMGDDAIFADVDTEDDLRGMSA